MTSVVYEFWSDMYDTDQILKYSQDDCEREFHKGSYTVKRFEDSIENLLNRNVLDVDNCYFRVFNN